MDVWNNTVKALQTTITPYDFMHWIAPIRCERLDLADLEIQLSVPDDAHARWIEENFLATIVETLRELTSSEFSVRVGPRKQSQDTEIARPPVQLDTIPMQPDLVARYRFETFVGGPNSQFALTAAQAVADNPGRSYNPLFLYGGVGLGKTHLLHAIGHAILESNPRARVLYVTSETFLNDLISAIRNDRMDLFRARYRDRCDVLLVDDIQFIAGKGRTQEEFFHMFNTLYSSHKQIVLTSDQVPQSIPDLEERLCSRLQWGLLADIKPPGFETRVAILKGKAEADGVDLPDDVAMLLAQHITRNVRELEGALMRLGANARVFGCPITLNMAEELLGDVASQTRRQISPDAIIKCVCNEFHVELSDLRGPRRHRHVTLPRQVAMYLIRELTDASLPVIGSFFGGRDHTTVINALKRMEALRKADPDLRRRVDSLRYYFES